MIATKLFAFTLGGAFALLGAPALADDSVDGGAKPTVVQNRQLTMRHEYSVFVGVLPMDAFTKGVTLTGAYTLHFSNLLGWEVAQFSYSLPVDTGLKDELENLPQPIGPTPFEVVQYYATSNFVFKPIYGKSAVLNKSVIRHETFFLAGAGVGRLTISTRPVLDVGLGVRVYAGNHLSFRLDARDYLLFNSDEVQNELWIGLGMSLDFGG